MKQTMERVKVLESIVADIAAERPGTAALKKAYPEAREPTPKYATFGLRNAHQGVNSRVKAKSGRPVTEKSKATLDASRVGGQAQMLAWVDDRTLIPSKEFGARRGVERQALAGAVKRNALFGFKVNNLVYYPAVLADMPAADSSALCLALGTMSPGEKLLFLLRKHGALDGLTASQAVHESKLARVLELAAAWADEDSAPA